MIATSTLRHRVRSANHYFYVPLDLVEKVISCEYLKARYTAP